MANQASVEQQLELITKGLTEVHGEDSIRQLLEEGKNPKGYWGIYFHLIYVRFEC
jgi:tyrosyl-tRNA synthetase